MRAGIHRRCGGQVEPFVQYRSGPLWRCRKCLRVIVSEDSLEPEEALDG